MSNLPNMPRIEYKTDYVLTSLVDNWRTKNYTQEPLTSIAIDQVDTCKKNGD